MHESADMRGEAFAGRHPGDFTLALWGEDTTNGEAALARIANPAALIPDLRLAVAHFLHACPVRRIAPLVLEYATDHDLRVANTAAPLLNAWRSPVTKPEDLDARFQRLCGFLESLPANPTLPNNPEPFPTRKPDFDAITFTIANTFPDGAEATVERFLPIMETSARDAVVSRLNRYRLTEENRSLAKILHGDRPDDWQNWLRDNQGSQLFAQRQLLLKMLGDRSMEVAEHAFKAVKGFTISGEEAALLRPIFASKSAKKHLFVTHLYAQQPPALIERLLPDLQKSKRPGERLAALEILRRLAENEPTAELARKLWKAGDYQPQGPEEQRALDVLEKALGSQAPAAGTAEAPSLDNAFGLVDPGKLAHPLEPREDDILLHSPVSEKLIHGLDEWLVSHADTLIPSTRPGITTKLQRLGDTGVPYLNSATSLEENLLRFPPAEALAEWWDNRPAEMRDPDGFEMIRLKLTLGAADGKKLPVLKVLFGLDGDISTKSKKYQLEGLAGWIKSLRPDEGLQGDWRNYLIDATETAYARLDADNKNWAHLWYGLVRNRLIPKDDSSDEILERIWKLARHRNDNLGATFATDIHDVARFHQRGIATDDEVIWKLIGARKFKDKYDRAKAFSTLSSATEPPRGHQVAVKAPAFQNVLRRVCDRIIELELGRGKRPKSGAMRRMPSGASSVPGIFNGSSPLLARHP